jgi:AraC-like DNA-binding protein
LRGTVSVDRRVLAVSPHQVQLAQRFHGTGDRAVVTHGASVLALVRVEAGALHFVVGQSEHPAPRRFWLVIPPRNIVRMRFCAAKVVSEGLARFALPVAGPPRVVACETGAQPWSPDAAAAAPSLPATLLLDADDDAPAARGARQLLHQLLAHPAPVRAAARRLGVKSDSLTRSFGRAYGLAPKEYCHRARLFEAVLRLLTGRAIVRVAFDVGFNDLSRFYAQFRRHLGATPGLYTAVGKRQDQDEAPWHSDTHVEQPRRPDR